MRADKEREAADGLRRLLGRPPRPGRRSAPRCSTPCSATAPTSSTGGAPTSPSARGELLDVAAAGGAVTEAGVRGNVSVALRYLVAWLSGNGAAAIDNLMEDAATAEISRSQLWQWIRHGTTTDSGVVITREHVAGVLDEEFARLVDRARPGRA